MFMVGGSAYHYWLMISKQDQMSNRCDNILLWLSEANDMDSLSYPKSRDAIASKKGYKKRVNILKHKNGFFIQNSVFSSKLCEP